MSVLRFLSALVLTVPLASLSPLARAALAATPTPTPAAAPRGLLLQRGKSGDSVMVSWGDPEDLVRKRIGRLFCEPNKAMRDTRACITPVGSPWHVYFGDGRQDKGVGLFFGKKGFFEGEVTTDPGDTESIEVETTRAQGKPTSVQVGTVENGMGVRLEQRRVVWIVGDERTQLRRYGSRFDSGSLTIMNRAMVPEEPK